MCLGGRIHGRCCDGPKVIKPNVTVPLIGASSKVTVIDFVAQVELKQRYENQVSTMTRAQSLSKINLKRCDIYLRFCNSRCGDMLLNTILQDSFPIEATYEFPLPEGAAVTAFIIEVDGKTIHSKIKEKEEAKEIYDDAIAEGHGKLNIILEKNQNDLKINSDLTFN